MATCQICREDPVGNAIVVLAYLQEVVSRLSYLTTPTLITRAVIGRAIGPIRSGPVGAHLHSRQ